MLDYVDTVFHGSFNTIKVHGAFKENYTPQNVLDYLAQNLYFKVTTQDQYQKLMNKSKIPYKPSNRPGPYFKKLIITQVALESLGPLYASSTNNATLVVNALQAFCTMYGKQTLLNSLLHWRMINEPLQTLADYPSTIFGVFQTFLIKELVTLSAIAVPVQANLAEVTKEQELTATCVNLHEKTIVVLQAELAALHHSSCQEPTLIPKDLQTVLSNLTLVTNLCVFLLDFLRTFEELCVRFY